MGFFERKKDKENISKDKEVRKLQKIKKGDVKRNKN